MRRFISFLLLVFIFFETAGTLVIFELQRFQIRREVKQHLKAGVEKIDLVLLKIPIILEQQPNKNFRRIHKGEFRYRGRMYDIVRQENHGETTWYYCISDEEETQLYASLDDMVTKEMNRNKQRQEQNEKLRHLRNQFCFNFTGYNPVSYPEAQNKYTNYFFKLKTWCIIPPTPPPEV